MRRLTSFPGCLASAACGCASEVPGKTGVQGRLEVPSALAENGRAGSDGDANATGQSTEAGRDGGFRSEKAAGPPSTHVAARARMPLLEARGGEPAGDAARRTKTRGRGPSWLLAAGVHGLPEISLWSSGVPGVLGRERANAKFLFSMGRSSARTDG